MQTPYTIRNCVSSNVKKVIALNPAIVDYYEITTVQSGTLHYNVDGKDYFLEKGDTLIIRPGNHRVRFAATTPAHYFPLVYYSDGTEEKDLPDIIHNCGTSLKKAYQFLEDIFNSNTPHRNFKAGLGIHIFIRTLMEEASKSNYSLRVQQILQYISEHFTERISTDDIAAHVHLTVPYCCHLVKKELNTTIYELILNERISLAQNYLRSGEVPLNEIPFYCGFSDYAHFYKCFKKHLGMSPTKYQSNAR